MKRHYALAVSVLSFLACIITLSGCKKKDLDVENIKSWEGGHSISPEESVFVKLETGEKEGDTWLSFYEFIFEVHDDDMLKFAIIKEDENKKGLAKFEEERAGIMLTSNNPAHMGNHYFDNNSNMVVQKDQIDQSKIAVSYHIILNDGKKYEGNFFVTMK